MAMSPWTVWMHRTTDKDWSEASYTPLVTTADAGDMWGALLAVRRHFDEAMFFVMAEGVPPLWEHPANIDGGCFSLRVPCERAWGVFENLVAHAVTHELGPGVQGVSNSFKGKFHILKVWCAATAGHQHQHRALEGARFMPNRSKSTTG